MNENPLPGYNDPDNEPTGDTLRPLPGEAGIPNVAQPTRVTVSKQALLILAVVVLTLGMISAIAFQRLLANGKGPDDLDSKRNSDRPAAASTEPKRLDMAAAPASGPASSPFRVPAIMPTSEELGRPIGVRRNGNGASAAAGPKPMNPEDAPVMVMQSRPKSTTSSAAVDQPERFGMTTSQAQEPASGEPLDQTRRNLDGYQRQLGGVLDNLSRAAAAAGAQGSASSPSTWTPMAAPPSGRLASSQASSRSEALSGGQLQTSTAKPVMATTLGNRSLILPKGTSFTCALKTKIISAASGPVGCQVQRNVYSDDGRVLLIERGSHLDGEYRVASVRPGTVRIPVVWTRIRTPNGVTADLDSPGTGPLGEAAIDGWVDNRWADRIGAAMLLSLINDSVKLVIEHPSSDTQGGTVVLPSTTGNTNKLAEKVLDSTINIPPLIYQNQGGIVGIYVARDVDFSAVYELKAVGR